MGKFGVALTDLGRSIRLMPLAFSLAADDLAARYRRTVLGPLWITIGQAVTIGGMVLVFGVLFGQDSRAFAGYLAVSFPIFTMIMAFVTDMPVTFIASKGFIESYDMPWLLHIFRRAFGYFFTFLHQMVTFVVLAAVFHQLPASVNIMWVLPAIGLILVAGLGVGLTLAVIGARYRDVQPAVAVASSALFLFTPVMWRPESLHANTWIVTYNPLYYFLEITRQPLMGGTASETAWIFCSVSAAALFVFGLIVFALGRPKLYHWIT